AGRIFKHVIGSSRGVSGYGARTRDGDFLPTFGEADDGFGRRVGKIQPVAAVLSHVGGDVRGLRRTWRAPPSSHRPCGRLSGARQGFRGGDGRETRQVLPGRAG